MRATPSPRVPLLLASAMLRGTSCLVLSALLLLPACKPEGATRTPTATVPESEATAKNPGPARVKIDFGPADEAAVVAVLEGQRDAWNSGDLEAYMAGYEKSELLVFTSGAHIRHGWQETFDKYQERYGGDSSTMGHLEFRLHEIRGLGADAAVVLGHWTLTETEMKGEGVFSVILLRTDAGWKVVHDHTSSTEPEPAPEPEPGADT